MREFFELAKTYVASLLVIAVLAAFAGAAFAQGAASLPADLTNDQALALLLQSIGGLKGATALGIVAVVVQVLMIFFRTPLANFAGKFRLLVVSVLSLVGGVLALKVTGVDWLAALTHSSTLTAVTVFGHQVVTQFKKEA